MQNIIDPADLSFFFSLSPRGLPRGDHDTVMIATHRLCVCASLRNVVKSSCRHSGQTEQSNPKWVSCYGCCGLQKPLVSCFFVIALFPGAEKHGETRNDLAQNEKQDPSERGRATLTQIRKELMLRINESWAPGFFCLLEGKKSGLLPLFCTF